MIAVNRLRNAPRGTDLPTEEQIAKLTAQIRTKWTERTHRMRAGLSPEGLRIMVVALQEDRDSGAPCFSSIT
jgi:hypothetical protein